MSLETSLTFDDKKDKINGFVELTNKKDKFADHALVFMLRGAVYKWQQPVAFYYCEGATSGLELKSILRDITTAVVECGLKPIALICDQGSAFQSALNSFMQDSKRDQIQSNLEPGDFFFSIYILYYILLYCIVKLDLFISTINRLSTIKAYYNLICRL